MANIFGIIVSGRPVQTEMVAVSETKFVTEIPDADDINHIVVFMTGAAPFPDGMGAAVHFCWPETGWSLLGFLANDKPSVIFRVSGLKTVTANDNPFAAHSTHIAQIGISVEPIADLSQQTPVSGSAVGASTAATFVSFAEGLAENFLNYVGSFSVTQAQMTPQPSETFIPFRAVEQWYNNVKIKLQNNPYFWKK